MDTKIDIKKIHLGKSTAEKEYNVLHNYYVSTRAYLNAKDEKKRKLIYIGHRGSGKSALFNQIAYGHKKANSKSIIINIHPVEYSYDTFKRMNHDFFDIKAAYSIAWHYVLIIHAFKEVVKFFEDNKNIKTNRDNINIISTYLVKNDFKNPGSGLEVFLKFLSTIAKAKITVKYDEFMVGGSLPPNAYVNMLNMNDIKQPLRALEAIASTYPIHIFIDELDTGWNNTNEAKNYVSGLLYAAMKLNGYLNISVYLSLRQDMYNNLSSIFKDTEKIRDDIEFLKWDKAQLEALICRRSKDNKEVKEIYNGIEYVSNREILNLIFEEGVFEYILKNTLQRPRELIHFCSQAIERYSETYLERQLYNKKIDLETIKSIENRISLDRLNDFCKEYDDEFNHIDSIIWHFEGCYIKYTLPHFINTLEDAMISLDEQYPALEWLKPFWEKPIKLATKLFEIGFIKINITNNPYDYFAYYEKNSPHNFSIVKSVKINNIFRSALQCI